MKAAIAAIALGIFFIGCPADIPTPEPDPEPDPLSVVVVVVPDPDPDTTPPSFSSATVNGSSLVITLSEPVTGAPDKDDFYLTGMSLYPVVTGVAVSGEKITLTLSPSALISDISPTVRYTKGAAAKQIKDSAGNVLGSFSSKPVANETGDATYTVTQQGGAAGGNPSTAISFSFDAPVSGLTKADISILSGPVSVTEGDLSGSGTTWSLTLLEVSGQGDIRVRITKSGIEAGVKTVTVYPQIVSNDGAQLITFRVEQISGAPGAATTGIKIIFSEPVSGLLENDIVITPKNYNSYNPATVGMGRLTGSGTEWTIAITSVTTSQADVMGGVAVSVNKAGVRTDWKPGLVVYSSPLTYTAVQMSGEPYKYTSGGIRFDFSEPVAGLTADDIIITSTIAGVPAPAVTEVWAGAKGSGATSGTIWIAALSVTFAQTVNVRITKPNIDAGVKTISLYHASGVTFVPRVINTGASGAYSGDYGTLNTTAIEFVFSAPVISLTGDNITFTGSSIPLTKGPFQATGEDDGIKYILYVTPVSATTASSFVTVSISWATISPQPMTIQVFKYVAPPPPVPPPAEPDLGIDYTVHFVMDNSEHEESTLYSPRFWFTFIFDESVDPLDGYQVHIKTAQTGDVPGGVVSLNSRLQYSPPVQYTSYILGVEREGYVDIWITKSGVYGGNKRVYVYKTMPGQETN
jgi:hypothetical protein